MEKFYINLFKLIRDNFSIDYTLAIEIYFKKSGFTVYSNEFLSMSITYEALNMILAHQSTKKVSNEHHYKRSILVLHSDGTSKKIQRRFFHFSYLFGKKNNYKRKIEMTRFAYTSYLKIVVDLRNYLRAQRRIFRALQRKPVTCYLW